jgi:diguanylate cyclase (GGDEF)-like protein
MGWGCTLYSYGDLEMRSHVIFFLALTQIACVFLLMPLRSAALGVSSLGLIPFFFYFLLVDHHRMWVEAVIHGLVGFGMVATLLRYNRSFSQLIQSQRSLYRRQEETQQLSDENRRIAFTDPLSSLPNRRALLARLDALSGTVPRAPHGIAIVFIDLDGFKIVNDGHGHQFGDALINRVAELLGALCPDDGLLVRMGGDEFAVLLHCANATLHATRFADRALDQIARPLTVQSRKVQIGASIGIAADTSGEISPYELLRRADTAMYYVKERGKGGSQHYVPSLDRDRLRRQTIEQEIEAGLTNHEFMVAYQPQVDASSGACVGAEALVRWPGRPAGALPPEEFIEIAELGGLIHRLGLFVLRQACTELLPHPHLMLSVNISPAQLRQIDFESDIVQVLRQTGFPPHRLQLEITERYLIDHPERARTAINRLKALGVSFALDDFGTGFASIAYLRSYGFDCVKIDKSLSAKLGQESKAALLISGMVNIALALDMHVVAEGVETRDQADLLRAAGCHRLQGFLFGKPESADSLARPLAAQSSAA